MNILSRKMEDPIPPMTPEEQGEMRKYLAFSHEDQVCHIYGDDGELQCSNLGRHGRFLDFRREPISDLLENSQMTQLKEFHKWEGSVPEIIKAFKEQSMKGNHEV